MLSQLTVEGRIPSNPVLQNCNSESVVFWDTLYCANDFVENVLRQVLTQDRVLFAMDRNTDRNYGGALNTTRPHLVMLGKYHSNIYGGKTTTL